MQRNESVLIEKESFNAIGLKWVGTFAEAGAGGIRVVQAEMLNRLKEISHIIHPKTLLGLSYHITEGGFTHFAAVEVEQVENIPEGMTAITVPKLIYASCEHKGDQNIDASYKDIYNWIEGRGFELSKGDLTHLEEYPLHQDPYTKDPEFVIMIPIEKLKSR
ncbi:GyrI-like domain-containing protein [Cohnella abietis]|uniref:AraC effector-binding domain-containing protein n=1 Tax=Cohnella abietis TaxID=2507935 RepID=A0A3T1DEG5_9BACL|nr:effector binding domain-containing protein [Cohnella abietis]BBI36489.1 hypothetical protein KCTCHS21_58880 [Cohnella abietis]